MAMGAWNSAKEILFTEIPYLTSAVVQTISSTFFKPVESNSHLPVLERIAQNTLKNPVDGSETTFKELWKNQRCVFVFLRRWGWPYSRLAAREISAIQPFLAANNVRLIGVGPEELGVKAFIEGKFLDGEVYVDSGKITYSSLDFNRMSIFDLLPALFAPKGLQAGFKSWQLGLQGNMFGDGWQNGGCLVVEKGGGNEPLLYYIQEKAPDHVSNEEVLKALRIDETNIPPAVPVQK